MNPAFSVLFLTTLIGAGQGLFVALFLAGSWPGGGAVSPAFQVTGSVLAVALMLAGLLASFLHLGRPERAWRAMAMWRTSWLSREVILLPLAMALIAAHGLLHHLGVAGDAPVTLVVGGAALVVTFALFITTGMIYASVRFLQEWATPLTTVNFTVLGCASGFCIAAALAAAAAPHLLAPLAWAAGGLTVLGLATRGAALLRNRRLRPASNLQSAIGVRHPRIVQVSPGFTGGSFNTREFFHRATARGLRHVRWVFLVAAFPVPLALLAAGAATRSPALLAACCAVQFLGLLAERWYFFAEANHPQNLYYQALG